MLCWVVFYLISLYIYVKDVFEMCRPSSILFIFSAFQLSSAAFLASAEIVCVETAAADDDDDDDVDCGSSSLVFILF